MQPQNGQLSKGFVPVEQAIKIIQKDRRDKAAVDLDWLALNRHFIQEGKNFRIPLARNATQEEIAAFKAKFPGRRPSPIVITGSVNVYIAGTYEKEILKQAIREMYKKNAGRELSREDEVHNKTTVQDDEHNAGARIKSNPNPSTKAGEELGEGETL